MGIVACALWLASGCAAGAAADGEWPTVAHDFQRTSYAAACPAPPYRVRWVWTNGAPLPAEKVKGLRNRVPDDLLPDFLSARFHSLAQPMVRGGVAYIGSVEGEVFAIGVKTGETKWRTKAGGPILHCVTVGEQAVFAATMRGVDAAGLDGKPLWRFEDPRLDSFWACPALDGGLVLAGDTGGTFYALDAASGKPRWTFQAGGPIYQTPAVHGGAVYFGAEDMHVYSLEAATGRLRWKSERLHGVSFGHYWPVVAAKAGKLLVRTSPFVKTAGCEAVNKAPFDHQKAQEALRAYFEKNPNQRDLFTLNLADGKETVQVITGHFGSQGDLAPVPIVRDDGSVLAWYYSKEGSFQRPKQWGGYDVPVDFGAIDFQTGWLKSLGPPGTTRPPAITRNDDFHHNTLGGNWLFGLQDGLGFGCVPLDGKGARLDWMCDSPAFMQDLCFGSNVKAKHGKVGFLGRNEGGAVCATLLPDTVLVNPACGPYIIAFESQGGAK